MVMLQTDEDDRYITETAMAEINNTIQVVFIGDMDELKEVVTGSGQLTVILINDSFRQTASEQLKD